MTSEAREATAVQTSESSASAFQLAYAIILVGAGGLAVFTLLYGIAHSNETDGLVWTFIGLVSYLAVWGWGFRLASS